MLPRESSSKGVDSSLIPTLSFPAFASHEERLVDLTKNNVITRLRGKKGFKRFSRDGYMSRLEDKTRRYYHKAEIKDFEGNECEWVKTRPKAVLFHWLQIQILANVLHVSNHRWSFQV